LGLSKIGYAPAQISASGPLPAPILAAGMQENI
jgi:hypothetical protein